jgi:hypothetical protein
MHVDVVAVKAPARARVHVDVSATRFRSQVHVIARRTPRRGDQAIALASPRLVSDERTLARAQNDGDDRQDAADYRCRNDDHHQIHVHLFCEIAMTCFRLFI